MLRLEAAVGVGLVAGTVLSLMRWRLKNVGGGGASALVTAMLIVSASVAPLGGSASAGVYGNEFTYPTWKGYLWTSINSGCQWIQQDFRAGDVSNQGWPFMNTVATVDGSGSCSNRNYQAAPGTESEEQDLIFNGASYVKCNIGPRISNGDEPPGSGYWTHAISTQWNNVNAPPPCSYNGYDGWYYINSVAYWNQFYGGPWVGGSHRTGEYYMWSRCC